MRKARAARTPEGVTILVQGGVHRLAGPTIFTPEDSAAGAESPFTIAAFGKEKPVLSGGVRLVNWKKTAPNLWQTDARAKRLKTFCCARRVVSKLQARLRSKKS